MSESSATHQPFPEKIIYIAGAGRNGSTLLGQCLAQQPGILFPGELTHVWQRGFLDGELCGCGEPFANCSFWQEVVRNDRLATLKIEAIVGLRNQVTSLRRLPSVLLNRPLSTAADRSYVTAYRELIDVLCLVGGCRMVVDSSKYPTDLAVLLEHRARLPPLHLIHLIRDCRAVVHAWKKKKLRSEIHWKTAYMPRYSSIQTTIAWQLFNRLIAKLAARYCIPYTVVRYEDFAAQPQQVLQRISAEIHGDKMPVLMENSGAVARSHAVGGNPSKFDFNLQSIRLDNHWVSELSRWDRRVVQAIAGRQLREYGYE